MQKGMKEINKIIMAIHKKQLGKKRTFEVSGWTEWDQIVVVLMSDTWIWIALNL